MVLSSFASGTQRWQRLGVVTVAVMMLATVLGVRVANAQAAAPPVPAVEGPITGPGPMYTGMRAVPPGTDTVDFRYLTEEYFVSGTARPSAGSCRPSPPTSAAMR